MFRTDVKGDYDAIDPGIQLDQLRPFVRDPEWRSPLYQYMHRCVHRDSIFRRVYFGIPTGCSLSPLMAALYLTPLDQAMQALESRAFSMCAIWVTPPSLAPTRTSFRRDIRIVNQQLTALRLEKHPAKNFIGKRSRGFDALGSRFDSHRGACGPSPAAVERFAIRIVQRYARYEGGESLRHDMNRWLGTQTCLLYTSPSPRDRG